jgi:hypothetical protein
MRIIICMRDLTIYVVGRWIVGDFYSGPSYELMHGTTFLETEATSLYI